MKVGELDGRETAERAKCEYFSEPSRYVIKLLNTEYVVGPTEKKIVSEQGGCDPEPAGFLEQLCILTYLINAQDLPLADKLVKAESLPGGEFFFRAVHRLPVEKLAEAFGQRPEALVRIGEQSGAKRCEFGDASIELCVLPRIPLTMVVWGACEEFPARASILFDQTAAEHLPLDALLAGVTLAVKAVAEN